ncbi:MAG: metallophosphoesterase family protein, partial [Gammaproteobacteria bacterium]
MPRPFIGLISDTHGLLRPQALEALRGSELIIHAGDIGKLEILEALEEIAPVHAVRGNNDRDTWAEDIPERRIVTWRERRILVLHDVNELKRNPEPRAVDAVISG